MDKVYFRRRDEESMYAEAYFKNKVITLCLNLFLDHAFKQEVIIIFIYLAF